VTQSSRQIVATKCMGPEQREFANKCPALPTSMAQRRRRESAITWNAVRRIGLALPETEESTSYGTPALKVKGKLFVRLREEGDIIVVRTDPNQRSMRMAADPTAFFVTEHYVPYPYMLVRLSAATKDDLTELLQDAWQIVAQRPLPTKFRSPRLKGRLSD
jgi:hypothetical protein